MSLKKHFSGLVYKNKLTWATVVAAEDALAATNIEGRRFSVGSRPVIRWIKGDGLDDAITRAAIGQATRLFGSEVDYCLCTQGIDADRVRSILEWASQPVEWWPISEMDNPLLAQFLTAAECEPKNFGYWWKWFPERVRPDAPEWILDGDMVITRKPDWFQKWAEGTDVVRVSQDDAEGPHIYGNYSSHVNLELMLYSGLVSLPPKCHYMSQMAEVLTIQPLLKGHNGKKDMSEQGVTAVTFQKLNAEPIPLYEFPFCRAFQDYIDFGLKGDQGLAWGYHFGNSFIMNNPHFERLTDAKTVFLKAESSLIEKFQWLGGQGQWGVPGWTMTDGCAEIILTHAAAFNGKSVLEMGTSRGRLSAMLASLGCNVTTIDHLDRGARENLHSMSVKVIIDDALHFLTSANLHFDLIICDLHGNSATEWKKYSKPLMKRVRSGSTLIISNALLGEIPEWHEETGVQWFLKQIPKSWYVKIFSQALPGVAVVAQKNNTSKTLVRKIFIERHSVIPFLKFQALKVKGIRQIWLWLKLFAQIRIIRQSDFFDKKYYLQNNPDVKLSGISAIKHYLLYGGFEGRKPSLKFDSTYYLAFYPDIKENGVNPLVHYLKFGKKEGRTAHTEKQFALATYLKTNHISISEISQVLSKIVDRIKGISDIELIRNSDFFNAEYYLRMNPDIKATGIDPAEHFVSHGWKEGRSPGNNFDSYYYLGTNPDIKESGICPLVHFIKYGKKEGRLPKQFEIDEAHCIELADLNILDPDLIVPNKLKIAIICHLYYLELADEFISYFRNMPIPYDLYLTTTKNNVESLRGIINRELPGLTFSIIAGPNQGRDIAPFITLLKANLNNYDLVCKIHSKKSGHDKNLQSWRKYLLDNLMGDQAIIKQIIYAFEQNPKLGIVYPLTFPYITHIGLGKGWGGTTRKTKNRDFALKYFPELLLEGLPDDFSFPVGSMFWFKPQALANLCNKELDLSDFETENEQIDGTLAHVIERLFNVFCKNAGFDSKTTFLYNNLISKKQNKFDIPDQYKKSILFIAHDLFMAGAEIVLLNVLRWFDQHTAFKAYVIVIKKGNDGGKLLSDYKKVSKLLLWEDLLQESSEEEAGKLLFEKIGPVDLIYGNTIIAANLYPYLNLFDAPIITHIHELEESIQKYTSANVRENFKSRTSRFIACSNPVRENLITNHAISDSKISLVHAFIKIDAVLPNDVKNYRSSLFLPQDKIIIWGCGTIYWRKGTDLFIETAIKLKNNGLKNFMFCWIGGNYWNFDENDWGSWEKYEKLIEKNGLTDTVHFLGEKGNPKDYFKAGDIFFLSSREDPFPLVCLEAAECGLPVVCFEGAGGMSGFVEEDAGIIVPFLDINAAADAITLLIEHENTRREKGQNARKKLIKRHTDDIAMPEILKICRKVIEANPLLSVIVPIYNQENFLQKRIDSILNQTFKDYEIILLDDSSMDSSFEIAESYLWHPEITLIRNDKNSGSPFKQWQKGIETAKGQIIWIAEGDDIADHLFLETLLPSFNNEKTDLAYCASHKIDETGGIFPEFYLKNGHYENLGYQKERWLTDYTADGMDEVKNALAIRNTIPNVSAVLFKKTAFQNVDFNKCTQFRVAGDWYIYYSILRNSNLFYSKKHLNFHRIHSDSVVAQNKKKAEETIPDYFEMHKMIAEELKLPERMLHLITESVTKGLKNIWPDLSNKEFQKLYDEFYILNLNKND
ncbi:MAG: rhamnan synthesis F family protein [Bacteroidota bacterium]